MPNFIKAFKNACKGIYVSIKVGHNLRLQFVAAFYCFILAPFFAETRGEWTSLILIVSMVLSLEIVNTSLERMCDIIDPNFNKIIKAAKDMAAGAVLICAISSLAIAAVIFMRYDNFINLITYCKNNYWYLALLIFMVIPSFIFVGEAKKK